MRAHKKDLSSFSFLAETKEVLQSRVCELPGKNERPDFPLQVWSRAEDR